jgi:hypothetical protein
MQSQSAQAVAVLHMEFLESRAAILHSLEAHIPTQQPVVAVVATMLVVLVEHLEELVIKVDTHLQKVTTHQLVFTLGQVVELVALAVVEQQHLVKQHEVVMVYQPIQLGVQRLALVRM